MITRNIVAIPLVLLLVLGTLLAAGCESGPAYTPEELETMLEDAVATTLAVETFAFDMALGMTANVTGEDEGSIFANVTAGGDADLTTRELGMLMDIGIGANMAGIEIGLEEINMELYQLDGWMYARLSYADEFDEWAKTQVVDELEESYGLDMITNQFNLLASPSDITYLREENVDNSPCHVLEVSPNVLTLIDWFTAQDFLLGGEFGLDEIDNIASLIDTLAFTAWIDAETGHVRQLAGDVSIRVTAEMLADAGAGADLGSADITVTVSLSLADFDVPVTIALPEAAAGAVEMNPEDFKFM